jgi:hypothetical protein
MTETLIYEDLLAQLKSILINVIEVDDSYEFKETDTFESISEKVYFDSLDKELVVEKLEDLSSVNFTDLFKTEIKFKMTLKEICETIIAIQ